MLNNLPRATQPAKGKTMNLTPVLSHCKSCAFNSQVIHNEALICYANVTPLTGRADLRPEEHLVYTGTTNTVQMGKNLLEGILYEQYLCATLKTMCSFLLFPFCF